MVEHQKYGPWQVFTASPECLQEISYLTAGGQTLAVDSATGKVSGLTFLQEVAFGLKWQESAQLITTEEWDAWQYSMSAQGFEVEVMQESTALTVVLHGVVERDDNVGLHACIAMLERVREQMAVQNLHMDVDDEGVYLSLYVWVASAVDTPQIDFTPSMLRLLVDLELTLDVVMYSYEP